MRDRSSMPNASVEPIVATIAAIRLPGVQGLRRGFGQQSQIDRWSIFGRHQHDVVLPDAQPGRHVARAGVAVSAGEHHGRLRQARSQAPGTAFSSPTFTPYSMATGAAERKDAAGFRRVVADQLGGHRRGTRLRPPKSRGRFRR